MQESEKSKPTYTAHTNMADTNQIYDAVTRSIASKGIQVLDSDDPVAEATVVENSPLGTGAERQFYKGRLELDRLTKEGYRQILIPIVTHQKLNGRHTMEDWPAKNEEAKEEVSRIKTKEGLEKEVRDAFNQQGILRGNHIDVAIGISKIPIALNRRDERCEHVLGLRGDNIAYHIAHGTAKSLPYNVIELMDGTLNPEDVKKKSPAYQLHVLKSLIKGLRRFKQLGIVHRDIKPDNMLYRGNHGKPEIKFADFGLYKADGIEFNYITETGACMGTPVFMSPEQPENAKRLTWHSDQFSAAAAMYMLITGKNPIGLPEDQLEKMEGFLLMCHVVDQSNKRPSFVASKNKQYEGMERILARMMQKRIGDRYQDYESILEDIRLVENKKLPQNADPGLVPTVFKPGQYSNYYNKLYRNFCAGGIGVAAATLLLATAHFMGGLDKISDMIAHYLPTLGK